MDVVPDEVAVRSLFDELTAGQPDAPPDRQRQVWRRIRRQRMARVVGALAAIAAATVVAVGIGTSATSFAPASGRRLVPAWALPWLDHRNGSVPQSVVDGAVRAWRDDAAIDGTPLKATSKAEVIWYVGQKVANGTVVVVIFETESKAGRRLIAGWAPTSELMHGRRIGTAESSPWVLYQVEAPKPGRVQFIGVNVHGPQMQGTSNPDNWIVVLAAPGVQDIGWTAPGPSSTTTNSQGTSSSGSAAIGIAQTVAGLAV
ncbi:MAG: hypothetical protein ACTHKL_11860, partial [Streptosporangiaceae bacterium]